MLVLVQIDLFFTLLEQARRVKDLLKPFAISASWYIVILIRVVLLPVLVFLPNFELSNVADQSRSTLQLELEPRSSF